MAKPAAYLEAPDTVVPLELFAVLVPLEGGLGVPVGLAPELDCLAGRDGVQLLLHLLGMSPGGSHGCTEIRDDGERL